MKFSFFGLAVIVLILSTGARAEVLTDAEILLSRHAEILQGWENEDADLIFKYAAKNRITIFDGIKSVVVDDDGSGLASTREMFKSMQFDTYMDNSPPVVKVSEGGTFGWVWVDVKVTGSMVAQDGKKNDLSFGYVGVEMYEKIDGVWMFVGGVAGTKPQNNAVSAE